MEFYFQRERDGLWLYREAGKRTGYRVARFEDDEEAEHFVRWFRLLHVVSEGHPHQALLFDDGPYRTP